MIALANGNALGIGREQSAGLRALSAPRKRGVVAFFAQRFADALRYARAKTTRPQDDPYITDAAKKTLSNKRSAALTYTVALLVDAADRGAAVEAESAVHELVAAIRATRGDRPLPTLNEAWKAEEAAEAEREQAEAAVITTQGKCAASRERFIRARAAYILADEDMEAVIRQLDTVAA